jgi:hypothetical protein
LDQKIRSDATGKQAAQDFSTIFSDYGVYVLVGPASRIAADADRVTSTAVPTFTAAQWNANHDILSPARSFGPDGRRRRAEGPVRRAADSPGPQGLGHRRRSGTTTTSTTSS